VVPGFIYAAAIGGGSDVLGECFVGEGGDIVGGTVGGDFV